MIRICSWCKDEGQPSVMGQCAPFGDTRETHGICEAHMEALHAVAGMLTRPRLVFSAWPPGESPSIIPL